MILIADSGSTKTTWANAETGNKTVTEGLNPHFSTDAQFLDACAWVCKQLASQEKKKVLQGSSHTLYFYGAGCGNSRQVRRVKKLLQQGFNIDDVHVETDMLGACRAVSNHQPCLVGILGTGSNACLYNGHAIVHQQTSTGYILGDKGSANHVGRMLLDDYLTHRMPSSLRNLFHDTYKHSDAQFIDAVYHQPHPNRFLASLAPFSLQHIDNDYCLKTVTEALRQWYFDVMIPLLNKKTRFPFKTWDGSVHFVGGFAKAVEPQLKELFHHGLFHLATVVSDPMEGLTRYHKKS